MFLVMKPTKSLWGTGIHTEPLWVVESAHGYEVESAHAPRASVERCYTARMNEDTQASAERREV